MLGWLRRREQVALRLTAASGAPDSVLVEAICLCGPIRRVSDTRAVAAQSTPVELPLPPGDLVAVVHQVGGSGQLLVEYEVTRGGRRRVYHRSRHPVTVVVHRGGRTFSGGLPSSAEGAPGAAP